MLQEVTRSEFDDWITYLRESARYNADGKLFHSDGISVAYLHDLANFGQVVAIAMTCIDIGDRYFINRADTAKQEKRIH